MNRREAVRGMGLAVLAGPVRQVLAQAYPSRPIRVLIPVAAGGSSDVLMRLLFERMGLPAVFDNRPGAGGALSAEASRPRRTATPCSRAPAPTSCCCPW